MMFTTDLYIGRIDDPPAFHAVLPEERQAQIEATRNERVKAQRFCAWDTLLKGLRFSRGLEAADAKLSKSESGKWVSESCGISISHCSTAVAAAIADSAVGVDIEPFEDARYREALLFRIATEAERALFPTLSVEQRIAVLWTRKEAAFKRGGSADTSPVTADAASKIIRTIVIRIDDRDYAVSAAAAEDAVLRVFEVRGESVTERTDYVSLYPVERV